MISAKLREACQAGRRKTKVVEPPAFSSAVNADEENLPTLPNPVTDPDDRVDPDDCALPALPPPTPSEMPAGWWEALLLGKPGDAVSQADAQLAIALIEARLREYQDNGQPIKRDPGATVSVGDELTATVGALHERIYERYEARGWFAFQQLYHEAAGLHPRPKTADALNAVSGSDAAPLNCDPIEPGLAEAIMQAPTKLQRWLLAPPREPPRWRTSSPPSGMDDGAWCG